MRKGISSLDAFLAIIVASFLVIMMQNYFNHGFDNAQTFGVQSLANTEAARIGSIMNGFFASNPAEDDYILLNNTVSIFGDEISAYILKEPGATNVTVGLPYGETIYNASYPVVAPVSYNSVTGRVTA